MKRHLRSSAERVAGLLVVLFSLVAAVGTAACGSSTAPPSSAAPSSSPSAAPAAAVERLDTEGAKMFSRSAERLELPYREYRCAGSLSLADATDRVAAFERNVPEGSELVLMDATTGRTRCALARATYRGSPGYWIGGVRLSDGWIAWEEVGPGDDLIEQVPWRLYAARLDRASLVVGKPRLVASALNTEGKRPLFDLSGSRLAWVTTAWAKGGKAASSRLTVFDLISRQRRVLYRSYGVLETVGCRRGEVIVSEVLQQDSPASRFTVLDIDTGRRLAAFDAGNEHPLSHWPAWRDGWLAWAPFPSAEATFPLLYLRDGEGRVFSEGASPSIRASSEGTSSSVRRAPAHRQPATPRSCVRSASPT